MSLNERIFELKNFGRKLRGLREERDLKQSEVAKAVHVGKAYVSSWENGKSKPSLDSIVGLANLFGVSVDYLLFENVPREGVEAINDFELYDYFRKTDLLPPQKKQSVKDLVDAIVFREKVKDIPESEVAKEMKVEPASLRKLAGKR
jgi:transcriptional regulator with XRE-family HTH domain